MNERVSLTWRFCNWCVVHDRFPRVVRFLMKRWSL
jgi:hypothetical protein